jgi:tetratricopeptide (TPR) repeat protein
MRHRYNAEGMASIRSVVATLVCCLTLAASAPSVAAADPAQGRVAFDEGQRLFLAGDYREALAWFKKGFLDTEDAAFLLNIAQCHRFLGEPKEALLMYRLYLRSAPEGVNQEARAVAKKAIRELEGEATARAAAPAVTPAVAETRTAAPSVAVPVPAGSAAALPAPSATPSRREFQQGAGGFPVLEPLPEVELKKLPAAPAIPPDKQESTVRHLRLAGMVCGAVGLVSVGAGVYYWSRASSLTDSANKATAYNQADYDQGKRAETMQWIFYGVGAVAIMSGAGLYLYSRWLPAAKQASVSLAPMVGPGTAGLQAHRAF